MRPLNEELSQQILSAAKTEFKKGFRNASMRSIAASVGVTTGAIYRYYSNKEALFDALVSHPAEEFFNEYMTYSENFSRQELDVQLATIPQLSEYVGFVTQDNFSSSARCLKISVSEIPGQRQVLTQKTSISFSRRFRLWRGKTIITIAHRLAVIQNADQIPVAEDVRIAECGEHDEPVRKEGLYKKFTLIREKAEGWRTDA